MEFNIYDKDFCYLIEKRNYQMLRSVYLTEILQYEYGNIVQSKWLNNPWYNHAYINQDKVWQVQNVDDFILICSLYLNMNKRKSCIYLPEELKEIGSFLRTWKYHVFEKENWWYFDAYSTYQWASVHDFLIYELTYRNFYDFARVFSSSFELQDNIEHINCLKKAFVRKKSSSHIGFIAYKGLKPVGTLCMIIYEEFCGIYAVATMAEYRNQGVFTFLFEYAIHTCRMCGIQHIFLQTVSTDECNEVYKKRGFINIFSRIGYLLID